jgi:hypothetical protein
MHRLKDTFNGGSFQPDSQLALIVETSIVDVHVAIDSQCFPIDVPIVPWIYISLTCYQALPCSLVFWP